MPLVCLTVRHDRTLEEARQLLRTTVAQVESQFAALLERIEWEADGNAVRLCGRGFEVRLRADAEQIHVTADLGLLGALAGRPLLSRIKGLLEQKRP